MPSIKIPSTDGHAFDAYMAVPKESNGAGILVIQEIFGVNAEVRKKCDLWAEKGYTAIAPDLFWRQEPNIDITDQTPAEWEKAFALMKGFDLDLGVEDLHATLKALREQPYVTSGKTGTVGYCLGGRLAYLMATRDSGSNANVSYYGVTLEKYLDEAKNITAPLMLHIAEEDEYVNKDTQAQIKAALQGNPHITIYSYPKVNHAFSRINGKHYNEAAAKLANQRTADFFAQTLLGQKAEAA